MINTKNMKFVIVKHALENKDKMKKALNNIQSKMAWIKWALI